MPVDVFPDLTAPTVKRRVDRLRAPITVIHGNRLRPYSWNTSASPGGGPAQLLGREHHVRRQHPPGQAGPAGPRPGRAG